MRANNRRMDPDRVSKRRLLAEYATMARVAEAHAKAAMATAVELYRIDPDAEALTNGTFTDGAIDQVVLRCERDYDCDRNYWRLARLLRWALKRLVPPKPKEGKDVEGQADGGAPEGGKATRGEASPETGAAAGAASETAG